MVPNTVLLIDPGKKYLRIFVEGLDHGTTVASAWTSAANTAGSIVVSAIVAPWDTTDGAALHELVTLKRLVRAHTLTVIATGLDALQIRNAYRAGVDNIIRDPVTAQDVLASLLRPEPPAHDQDAGFRVIHAAASAGDLCRATAGTRGSRGILARLLRDMSACVTVASGALFGQRGRELAVREERGVPRIRAWLLGPMRVRVAGREIAHWHARKARLLFAYLLLHRRRSIGREMLMEMLWPGAVPGSSRNCLNVTIHALRHTLHDADPFHEYILYHDEAYGIAREVDVRLDTEDLTHGWTEARARSRVDDPHALIPLFERAASFYRGDLLEDDPYEEWIGPEREHYREVSMAVLDRLSTLYEATGQWERAAELCSRLLECDSCQEEVHRRLMECYLALGRRSRAIRQYRLCTEVLRKELAADPSPATVALFERIAGALQPARLKRPISSG